ncbi:MAG: hypothetical protein GY866_29315 [Proteobacteria bacterium]|nr:hypothetical protein [Pseudomonadota bacterium]
MEKRIGKPLLLCFFVAVFAFSNCDKKERELENAKIELDELQTELSDLKRQMDVLTRRSLEMEKRVLQLLSGYPTGIWTCDDEVGSFVFENELATENPSEIIDYLNKKRRTLGYPDLVLKKIEKKTLHVAIDDAKQLTQRMGSAGAHCYLGGTTYSLTSVKDIDYVRFEFEAGDHAIPGKYDRLFFERRSFSRR